MIIHPECLYKPVFTAKGWAVIKLDTARIREFITTTSIDHCGRLYNRNTLFLTADAALAWIRKDYTTASHGKYGGYAHTEDEKGDK